MITREQMDEFMAVVQPMVHKLKLGILLTPQETKTLEALLANEVCYNCAHIYDVQDAVWETTTPDEHKQLAAWKCTKCGKVEIL